MGRKSKTFTIRLSKELCRSAKESACGLDVNSDRECPNITDVIEAYKEGIVDDMWENQQKILSLSRSLHDVFNVDGTVKVVSIPAIEDAESDKRICRLLATENNVEHLFHKEYAELVLLVGHLEVVPDLITNENAKIEAQVNTNISIIRRNIRNILHKLQRFGRGLGVPDIRNKLCRYKRKVRLENETDRINYAL